MKPILIIICGPTGIGKTKVAIEAAQALQCEIISADSRQIYKEMSIGTAVPSDSELAVVRHHFIKTHSIHTYYNASMFEVEVLEFLEDHFKQKNCIIMVGGSGLYIDAVCKGIDELPTIEKEVRIKWQEIFKNKGLEFLQEQVRENDPEYFSSADIQNPKRLLKAIEVFEMTGKPYSSFLKKKPQERSFSILKIGLNTKREVLYERINQRVDRMMEAGLTEEAKKLYPYRKLTPLNTVGYKELFEHFDGKLTLEKAREQIQNHSRAYARRQLTWFRRDKDIKWYEPQNTEYIIQYIENQIVKHQ